jgi:hypothetical protein
MQGHGQADFSWVCEVSDFVQTMRVEIKNDERKPWECRDIWDY